MNEQVTEAELFEFLGRLYASREILRLRLQAAEQALGMEFRKTRPPEIDLLAAQAVQATEGTG